MFDIFIGDEVIGTDCWKGEEGIVVNMSDGILGIKGMTRKIRQYGGLIRTSQLYWVAKNKNRKILNINADGSYLYV